MTNAITLYEPFAFALAQGDLKRFETRSWQAPKHAIGRPIAIHAGKNVEMIGWLANEARYAAKLRLEVDAEMLGYRPMLYHILSATNLTPTEFVASSIFHPGCVVALGILQECIPMTREFIAEQSPQEIEFGDWQVGRYAWRINSISRIVPIPARGAQGVWHWQDNPSAIVRLT